MRRPLPIWFAVTAAAACLCAGIAAILILSWSRTWAQSPPAPPPSCEAQLADAQQALIQLRKRAAQAEFQAASVEEIALGLQKRVQELTPKPTEEKKTK